MRQGLAALRQLSRLRPGLLHHALLPPSLWFAFMNSAIDSPVDPPGLRRLVPMERGFFAGGRGTSLYYALQGASATARQAWIMCNALLEEATFAARPWIEMADGLALQGHAAMRFDYDMLRSAQRACEVTADEAAAPGQ